MSNPARIVLADDHLLVLDGLRLILAGDPRWEVIGQVQDGKALLALLAGQPCDLVITDLNMPGMRGIALIQALKAHFPHLPVLVLTMHDEPEIVQEILLAEAEGYLLKNSGRAEVCAAVTQLLEGKTHYSPAVLEHVLREYRQAKKKEEAPRPLSARETEILHWIVAELNSREIAEKLFISKQTVDTHRAHIMEKTGARTLVGLIKFALRAGIEGPASL
ncbi:MAG: response regulator [Bacteroidetes bacterium]|nr:response regulator [Bacteroidota bacterium]